MLNVNNEADEKKTVLKIYISGETFPHVAFYNCLNKFGTVIYFFQFKFSWFYEKAVTSSVYCDSCDSPLHYSRVFFSTGSSRLWILLVQVGNGNKSAYALSFWKPVSSWVVMISITSWNIPLTLKNCSRSEVGSTISQRWAYWKKEMQTPFKYLWLLVKSGGAFLRGEKCVFAFKATRCPLGINKLISTKTCLSIAKNWPAMISHPSSIFSSAKKISKSFQLKRQQRSKRFHMSSLHAKEIQVPSLSTL